MNSGLFAALISLTCFVWAGVVGTGNSWGAALTLSGVALIALVDSALTRCGR